MTIGLAAASLLFSLVGSSGSSSPPTTTGELPVSVDEIERAVAHHDEAPLQQARERLLEARRAEPSPPSIELYTLAYVDWRLSQFYSVRDAEKSEKKKNKKKRDELLKEAESILKELTQSEPENAEAFSLLGAVYGGRITGMWSGMRLGPRADKALKQARRLDASNPRAALQIGVSALFKPGAFGGGTDKSIESLLEAIELFEDEDPDTAWPNWGRADCWIWLGQAYAKQGNKAEARSAYENALAITPHYTWVEEELLPALETER